MLRNLLRRLYSSLPWVRRRIRAEVELARPTFRGVRGSWTLLLRQLCAAHPWWHEDVVWAELGSLSPADSHAPTGRPPG